MDPFEYMSTLQYRVKALSRQIEEFKSGERYTRMENEHKAEVRRLEQKIRELENELSKAHTEIIHVRNIWMEAMEDAEKGYQKELSRKNRFIRETLGENWNLRKELDGERAEKREKQLLIYDLQTQLLEEQEKNRKLTAQLNKDFENSSLPSSMQGPKRKKIPNSREKTDRKQGGQPGHKGNTRKPHVPTESHEIPAPEYESSPDYYATGKIIRKQRVIIQVVVKVIEYYTKEYRRSSDGTRVHAAFPDGYVDNVNYGGTVKALAFLLGNECNVSHGKIKKLIRELTGGEVDISIGMINKLCREFSEKTEPEKKEIVRRLMKSPAMHADFTNANVNGKSGQVLILASASGDAALYIGREKKGHEGIRGTPLEDYVGTVVHDHASEFYSYGTKHQECMQHNCRYLTGSEQNEPELQWNSLMHSLIREMLHYKRSLDSDEDPDPSIVSDFEARYDEIIEIARKEYEYDPPSDYYREGYNLFCRLEKYKEAELLFLHDKNVPGNNSLCERLARVFKRKQKQATVLRSQEQLGYICDGLSAVYLLREENEDLYQAVTEIFNRKRPLTEC